MAVVIISMWRCGWRGHGRVSTSVVLNLSIFQSFSGLKCFMVTIHLMAGWLGSRLQTLYIRIFWNMNRVNEWKNVLWKSGQSLLSSMRVTNTLWLFKMTTAADKVWWQVRNIAFLLYLLCTWIVANANCVFVLMSWALPLIKHEEERTENLAEP